MTPSSVAILISLGGLLCAAVVAAGGALWRLGSKVGAFEAAVGAAKQAATDAEESAIKAQKAAQEASEKAAKEAQRAAGDAVAAARRLWQDMQAAVRDFQDQIGDMKAQIGEVKGWWREAHGLAGRLAETEQRLRDLEREHVANHGNLLSGSQRIALPQGSGRATASTVAEDGAPRLPGRDDDEEG